MALETTIANAVYASVIGRDATYKDASGDEIAVRVVKQSSTDDYGISGDADVSDLSLLIRVRKSDIPAQPEKCDTFTIGDSVYNVDFAAEQSEIEWRCYVTV